MDIDRLGGRRLRHVRRPRGPRMLVLLAVVAAVALTGLPGPGGDGAPGVGPVQAGTLTPLGTTTRFFGRGYGHGVGLSQHGARGRALEGQDAATILAHYFPGTTLGARDPARLVRVLVLAGFRPSTTTPFRVIGRGGPWGIADRATGLPADAVLEMSLAPAAPDAATTTWRTRVTAADGSVLLELTGVTDLRIVPEDPATRLQLWSKRSAWDTYRGSLRVLAGGASLSVVNHVELDAYLRGVVPFEMPSSWPTEALRAQAIVARSYAAKRVRTTSTFDLFDDARSQVYRGAKGETAAASQAVAGTAGQVVLYGSAVADTYYHSTAGGWTEDNEKAWVGSRGQRVAAPVPYLRGASDRRADGTSYDAASPSATWRSSAYSVAALSAIFARDARTSVGTLRALDLSRRGVSGRLIAVTLVGSLGTKTVSGEVFRAVFNRFRPATHPQLRSTLFALAPIP